MQSILCPPCRVVLPLLVVIGLPFVGLMMGCGGGHDHDHDHNGDGDATPSNAPSTGTQGSGNGQKESGLAAFLSGKRIVFTPSGEGLPPALASMQMLFQFEKDGTFNGGMVSNGKAMGESRNLKYEIKDLKISILKDGKADGGITFSSSSPKKGEKFTFEQKGRPPVTGTISKIEDAAPLAKMDLGFGPPSKKDGEGEAPPPPPKNDPSQPKDEGKEGSSPPSIDK
ncbi:MAG: hypothetical protein VX705_00950 [Verrucomicrobiota bacterium]|nr:hypothetical protein [Verrucomicrobiota bacterium]